MSDTTLHSLYNNFNSKPRQDIHSVLQGANFVNVALAEKHVIQEPDSTRNNITRTVFEKMTQIENIQAQSAISNYLGATYVQKNSELQALKQNLKDSTHTKDDDMINDLIGG